MESSLSTQLGGKRKRKSERKSEKKSEKKSERKSERKKRVLTTTNASNRNNMQTRESASVHHVQ